MGGVEVKVLNIWIASKEKVAGDHGEQGGDVMLIEVGQAFPESKTIIPQNLHIMEGADWIFLPVLAVLLPITNNFLENLKLNPCTMFIVNQTKKYTSNFGSKAPTSSCSL